MDDAQFREWASALARLTPAQRQHAFRLLALAEADEANDMAGDDARTCDVADTGIRPAPADPVQVEGITGPVSSAAAVAEVGARRIASIGCPHCGNHDVVRWGKASGLPRYRCRGCGRTFNGLTKTPLARLRKKDKWRDQAQAMIDGQSLVKTAEICGVDYTTAFRWRHRFLAAISQDKPNSLSGIVEGDETFILESFKGRRSGLPRKARKRGGKAAKRGLSDEQIPVIVARDRTGATIDAVLPRLDRAAMTAALGGVVTATNQLCCDGGKAIVAFARKARIPHHILPAPGKPLPEAPEFHINNVNAYHGRLKEWMRRFHGVATKNLPNYLGWRRALEAMGQATSPERWIGAAAGMGPYQQGIL